MEVKGYKYIKDFAVDAQIESVDFFKIKAQKIPFNFGIRVFLSCTYLFKSGKKALLDELKRRISQQHPGKKFDYHLLQAGRGYAMLRYNVV